MSDKKGFTLLEVLIVIGIMGLIAMMVVPRFAGLRAVADEVIRDTNQQRLMVAGASYWEAKDRFPSGLINLVDEDAAEPVFTGDRYTIPTSGNELEFFDEGLATFDRLFINRLKPQVHVLNADEAEMLRRIGVGTVYNLNAYDYEGIRDEDFDKIENENKARPLRRSNVESGLGVLMVGMGASDTAGASWTGRAASPVEIMEDADWIYPDAIGRIVLGVGPDSSLVTEGMVSASGLCPEGIGNEQAGWKYYGFLLPRLEATVKRMTDEEGEPLAGFEHLKKVMAVANGGHERGVQREFKLLDGQEHHKYLILSPKGHRWMESGDMENWMITEVWDGEDNWEGYDPDEP